MEMRRMLTRKDCTKDPNLGIMVREQKQGQRLRCSNAVQTSMGAEDTTWGHKFKMQSEKEEPREV